MMLLLSATSAGESATSLGPALCKPFGLCPGAVLDHQSVTRLQEVPRHGHAHDPETHETNSLHRASRSDSTAAAIRLVHTQDPGPLV